MCACREAETADAFTRELLGLLEDCLDAVDLGQVLELVDASKVLGPYQRRRLLKQAARVLQPKVSCVSGWVDLSCESTCGQVLELVDASKVLGP